MTEESGRIFESEDNRPQVKGLFINLKKELPKLEKLLDERNSHWEYEDPVYRFYHQSLKVYRIQETTKKIVEALQSLYLAFLLLVQFPFAQQVMIESCLHLPTCTIEAPYP